MTAALFGAFLISALRLSVPLVYAGLGGMFCERTGVVNIALEGFMLISAFSAAAVTSALKNPWAGFAAGIAGGVFFSGLHGLLCLVAKADHVISGMALNFLALGLTPVFSNAFFGMSGGTPLLSQNLKLPAVFGVSPLIILLIPVILFSFFLFSKTTVGRYIRFCGECSGALSAQGISPNKIRWIGILFSGFYCGVAGAYLSIDHGAQFSRNMTSGRGYMALAALIVGRWKPVGTFLAALVFGATESAQILLQGITFADGRTVPVQWVQALSPALTNKKRTQHFP
jgi:simple sugar transport system permease protein